MSTSEEVATALENAADYIEVHGWCQGNFENDDGGVCMSSALGRANSSEVAMSALRTLYRQPPCSLGVIPFNDAGGRTKFEVIDVLRLTAKDLRNGDIEVAS